MEKLKGFSTEILANEIWTVKVTKKIVNRQKNPHLGIGSFLVTKKWLHLDPGCLGGTIS